MYVGVVDYSSSMQVSTVVIANVDMLSSSFDDSCGDKSESTLIVTALEGIKILGNNSRKIQAVWKELCYGKAETLEDAEGAARWWRYNLVR